MWNSCLFEEYVRMQPGDSLFFGYSGHGGQEADPTGKEVDGMNSTLIPADYRQVGGWGWGRCRRQSG